MKREQIEDLADKITLNSALIASFRVANIINEWFEQNPIAPLVVGLSGEQLRHFYIFGNDWSNIESFCNSYKEWAKTQTFEVRQIPVGLSDEQVEDLAMFIRDNKDKCSVGGIKPAIFLWMKNKTFAQPVEFSNIELSDMYQALMEDFQELQKELEQLKAQQFTPNWDDAPATASYLSQMFYWFDDNHMRVGDVDKKVFHRPTPPAPKVEVGQVWSYGVFDVRVIGVNAIVVAYQGINNNDIETTDIRDFLAKFERVGE